MVIFMCLFYTENDIGLRKKEKDVLLHEKISLIEPIHAKSMKQVRNIFLSPGDGRLPFNYLNNFLLELLNRLWWQTSSKKRPIPE